MRILIVDDEEGVRQVCQRALRQAGHEVAACVSGDEALTRLGEKWDLVVTDLSMPGRVDGNEIIRRVRAASGADVALMTAYPTLDSSIAAMKDGACDYLLKPFTLGSLLELVRRRENGRAAPPIAPVVAPRSLRMATVLFADVRGFTAFTQSVSAEKAAARLDAMLACLIDAVHAEGGTIHKFIGDGAMALFGLPLPHADPAAAAARAALRARDAVAGLGTLRFGFGINTGMAAAGRLGTDRRSEYEVIGGPVNLAARLEEAAGPGRILLGEETVRLLDGRFVCGESADMLMKGFREPVRTAELYGFR